MPKRPGRKSAAQTPAPRSERKYGSKKNKPGSASAQSEAKITLSDQIVKGLEKKAKDFNEKYPGKKVTVGTLKKVFRRGAGAFSKSYRPFISGNKPNSRTAWSYARVNKFLKKKAGQKVKAAYVQDDDLMAKGGQVYNDKELLAKYKKGESIGFTATAHLKAKGLIPRADGTKKKSEKYLENGGGIDDIVITNKYQEFNQDVFNEVDDEELHGFIVKSGKKEIGIVRVEDDILERGVGYIFGLEVFEKGKGYGKKIIEKVFELHPNQKSFGGKATSTSKGFWLKLGAEFDGDKNDFILTKDKLFDSKPDMRYDDGGIVFVRHNSYDNSATIRRLPYRGVSAFAVHTDDFEKFKHYAEKEEGVDMSNWEVYNLDDFDNYELCAMHMSETNDYVMGYSDDKPTLKKFDAEEHTMYVDEDGLLDYDDAHEIIILPKKMNQGGMTALFVNSLMDSAKDIDYVIEYAIENDINPKEMSFSEFNKKVNPDGKYSTFEIRLTQRELNKYFKSGGDIKQSNIEITCEQCGWQWNTADSKPEDATLCHKCGYNNVSKDIIQINSQHPIDELTRQQNGGELPKPTEEEVIDLKSNEMEKHGLEEFVYAEQTDPLSFFAYKPIQYKIQDFICMEQDLVDSLLESDMTKIGKIRICQAKINLAENKLKKTESEQEYEAWYMSNCIWRDCMNILRANLKAGGRISGCECKEYKDGGLAYGNSHAKGGMPMTVKSTGQNIEIEGGEGVVNKRSMQMKKEVEYQGKKMTPCEVISSINEMGGGVKFKCEDVKKIIEKDGEYD